MEGDDVLPEPVADDHRSTPVAVVLGTVILLLLLSALLAALLVARHDDPSPAERVAAATGAAEEARTFAFDLTTSVGGAQQPVGVTLHGVVDADARRSQVTGPFGAAPIVLDGDTLYMPAGPAAPKPWVKVDLAALQQRLGLPPGVSASVSPFDALQQLRAVDAVVEDVGRESVRGVATTHERTTLDLTKVPGFPSSPPPAVAAMLGELRHVPYDVWLDDQDRPRRLTTTFAGAATTMELYDYGKPVTVSIPPADQVSEGP